MCTRDAGAQRIEAARPFRDQTGMFHVYRLPPRRVADGATKHAWSYGARLGRSATGQWSNMAEGSKQPPLPPALRTVNWRELLQILQASRQVGLPRSVDTDASLGWFLYCYRSTEILIENCLGAQNILLRVVGARSKGSERPMLQSPPPTRRGSLAGGRRTRFAYGKCMAPWPLAPTQPRFTSTRSNICPPDGAGLRPNAKFCYLRPWIRRPCALRIHRSSRLPTWPWKMSDVTDRCRRPPC